MKRNMENNYLNRIAVFIVLCHVFYVSHIKQYWGQFLNFIHNKKSILILIHSQY